MCSVRLVMRFVYDILMFRSRVVLACHVFPFLRLSLCFVIGSLSCVSVVAFVSLFCDWLFVMCFRLSLCFVIGSSSSVSVCLSVL